MVKFHTGSIVCEEQGITCELLKTAASIIPLPTRCNSLTDGKVRMRKEKYYSYFEKCYCYFHAPICRGFSFYQSALCKGNLK